MDFGILATSKFADISSMVSYANHFQVPPLDARTIPELELCAALLSSKLIFKIKKEIPIENHDIHFWCDFEIVLWWIHGPEIILQK